MKFKALLLALAVTVMAGSSFAQFAAALIYEGDGITGLHTTCDGQTPIDDGGAIWRVFDAATDAQVPQGGGFNQAVLSEWPVNGNAELGIPGGLYASPLFGFTTNTPSSMNFYVVCDINPGQRWISKKFSCVPGPDNEEILLDSICINTVQPCTAPDRHDISVNNWHTFAPYYQCLELCPGVATTICLGPLKADNVPHSILLPGCNYTFPGCTDPNCPPAAPVPGPWFFTPFPGSPFGTWCMIVVSPDRGCVCLCIDFIESAELGSFDAVAGDNSVTLNWFTNSSSDVSSYQISRNGEFLTSVEAENSASRTDYTYTDNTAVNGTTYTYSLAAVDMEGNVQDMGVTVTAAPSMNAAVITEYALHQNYPNPFNPTTNIVFDVVSENFVNLTVYNAMGQEVAELVNGSQGAGRHTVAFDAANMTSGLYFYTVKIGNEFSATKKMLLVK